jgi:sensor c-di-GMP phosphodiesterase-like protein
MIRILKERVLVARATTITMAAGGLAAGYLLGCALALHLAENWLDRYSKLTTVQDDASFVEARSLLTVLKDSPYSFCSDAEMAYFRELVFRSEYLKDAGRIHGGKIDCSATAGHPTWSIGQFNPDSPQKDGTLAYSNLVPIRDASLKRAGLQMGSAYVVFGSQMPASLGPISTHLTVTREDVAGQQSGLPAIGAPQGKELNLTTDGTARLGDTLYATRCSTLHFDCVTASTSVSDALHGERGVIAGSTGVGGLSGILLGMAFSFVYSRSRDLCQQLRWAIARDKLQVVYQPIVSLGTGRIVGAEALARWNDEDGNAVGPDIFVKIAEEHGFVGAITKMVVRPALRAFAETLRNHPDFHLSVNVTAADLADPGFLPMLDDSLKRAKVKSNSLVIEITERSTANSEEAMETIRNLRRRGHSIHIDDFGTGYSNLDKLLYLYADTIKIDKAFTRVIGTESVAVAILPQILAMANSLSLEVVVEGIETGRQAGYFSPATQRIYGQGWFYGRPVTAEEFHRLLADDWSKALGTPEPAAAWTENAGALQIVGPDIA